MRLLFVVSLTGSSFCSSTQLNLLRYLTTDPQPPDLGQKAEESTDIGVEYYTTIDLSNNTKTAELLTSNIPWGEMAATKLAVNAQDDGNDWDSRYPTGGLPAQPFRVIIPDELPTIITPRLRLRGMKPEDAEGVLAMWLSRSGAPL